MNFGYLKPAATLICACLALSTLGGCAIVDQKVGLSYARPELYLNRHTGDIALLRPAPPAPGRNSNGDWVIGSLNNVHGVHQADLLSDRSTAEWIADALLYELKQAGYQASYMDALPQGVARGVAVTGIRTDISVNRGNVSSDARHDLRFNVDVYLNGDRAKTFTVSSRDERTVPFTASREELESILLQSLQEAMKRLVPDIIALIDKK